MDTCADTQPTLGHICRNTEVQSDAVDRQPEHESGDTTLNADPVPDNVNLSPSLHLVTNNSNSEVQRRQCEIHPSESEIQIAMTGIGDGQDCINSESHTNQGVVSVGSKEGSPSDHAIALPDESSATNIEDSKTLALANSQCSPSLCIETDFSATASLDQTAAGLEDHTGWTLRTELIVPYSTSPAHLMDEEEAREDIDYPCEKFPSSLPPSSSPPRLFSSSPCASSQSSGNGIESSKVVRNSAEEMVAYTSSHGCTHDDPVVLVPQDESSSESNPLLSCDVADVEAPSNYYPGADSPPQIEGDLVSSRKRIAYRHDSDESCGLQPSKRPKPDANPYLPPTPKRATVASHHRQFKKLATPFRPPTKFSVSRVGAAQTMKNKDTETTSSTPEITQGDSEPNVPAKHHPRSQPKILNTSRSVAQFKSPLINKVLPGDSRTIRLTPTVQTLERKLQLLKRAIKVKEDNEEEVLVKLAGKWMEAGREVAYDLWDATKDAVDLEGKATLVRKSYGWNNTNEGNVPWGWDTKTEDTSEGSCNPDSSMASYVSQRLTPKEDEDDVWNHTLGTMLRQLGVDPQTFGWDDDKEVFCD